MLISSRLGYSRQMNKKQSATARPQSSVQLEIPACRPASIQSTRNSERTIKLQLITISWMLIESGVALTSAWKAHSPALLAFGSDSFVELLSAVVVVLQFTAWFRIRPSFAARVAGVLLVVLAVVVACISTTALMTGVRPEVSRSGIVLTIAALAIMPVLSRAKRRTARITGDRALAADAIQSATCAYLAASTFIGLACNGAFHIRWIDPIAALLAIPILGIEARRALRGEVCGCC
jgi:divalent metal cation (Fe/Co/Zn/Cd) transporter